ncbi:hypothetical protein N2599_23710 (plasmid) [Rhizobium sullae]|uniref:Uncharacterized protein n=1 Tax=Rhizobium sullae TaxID=50338 RepID=A0A2N0D805_RHISU|nr:hypothetical protein [Rhizobium sullae]PKA42230.1 hypothetical protein CWR43_19200 [Rhizobium sullae]UWU18263.1 hypothetical protein N2599_23710 [Rhizobium sullae]
MNTANLQLEGLYMALAAMNKMMVEKGIISHSDVCAALTEAEARVSADNLPQLSDANRKSVVFPIRLLLLANEAAERGENPEFADYARLIGQQSEVSE